MDEPFLVSGSEGYVIEDRRSAPKGHPPTDGFGYLLPDPWTGGLPSQAWRTSRNALGTTASDGERRLMVVAKR